MQHSTASLSAGAILVSWTALDHILHTCATLVALVAGGISIYSWLKNRKRNGP